jgi:hypothetical protein
MAVAMTELKPEPWQMAVYLAGANATRFFGKLQIAVQLHFVELG